MSIELIIFLALWIISTEIVYFGFIREENDSYCYSDFENFIYQKMMSIMTGLFVTIILFGIPFVIATGAGTIKDGIGYIAYVWYYGIILAVALLFGINYYINIRLNKNEH